MRTSAGWDMQASCTSPRASGGSPLPPGCHGGALVCHGSCKALGPLHGTSSPVKTPYGAALSPGACRPGAAQPFPGGGVRACEGVGRGPVAHMPEKGREAEPVLSLSPLQTGACRFPVFCLSRSGAPT